MESDGDELEDSQAAVFAVVHEHLSQLEVDVSSLERRVILHIVDCAILRFEEHLSARRMRNASDKQLQGKRRAALAAVRAMLGEMCAAQGMLPEKLESDAPDSKPALGLSDYELARRQNMEQNETVLRMLGLAQGKAKGKAKGKG